MKSDTKYRLIYVCGDYIASSMAWLLFNVVRYNTLDSINFASSLGDFLLFPNVLWGQLLFPLLMLGLYWLSGYYNKIFIKSRIESIISTLTSTLIGTVFIYFIAIIDDPIPDRYSNYELVLILAGLLFGFVALSRSIISSRVIILRDSRKIFRRVAVVGTSRAIEDCINRINVRFPSLGLKVVAAVPTDSTPLPDYDGVTIIASDDITSASRELNIEQFILAMPDSPEAERMKFVRRLYLLNKPILQPEWYNDSLTSRSRVSNVAGEPLTDISSAVISESTRNIKRTADIIVSAIALIILLPVFGVIAVCIRWHDGGPILFAQERIGYHGKKFRILKFRTMVPNAELNGPALSHVNDSRITPLGHFLRKYRLDELPQFWNVLKGEMSLVGPRPEREYFEEQIIARAPEFILLHQLRPGITSWGMVKYGYASDIDAMLSRMRYDIIYLENVSVAIDLKILFYTVNTVITGKGI